MSTPALPGRRTNDHRAILDLLRYLGALHRELFPVRVLRRFCYYLAFRVLDPLESLLGWVRSIWRGRGKG